MALTSFVTDNNSDFVYDPRSRNIVLTADRSSIASQIRGRLKTFFRENYLAFAGEVGVKYFETLAGEISQEEIQVDIRNQILSVPGVISITDLKFDLDENTRLQNVSGVAQTEFGLIPLEAADAAD